MEKVCEQMGFLPQGHAGNMESEVRGTGEPSSVNLLSYFSFLKRPWLRLVTKETQTSIYKCPSRFLVKAKVTH